MKIFQETKLFIFTFIVMLSIAIPTFGFRVYSFEEIGDFDTIQPLSMDDGDNLMIFNLGLEFSISEAEYEDGYWHLGLLDSEGYVIGWAQNLFKDDPDWPEYHGLLYGEYSSGLGYGNRPANAVLVYDKLNNGWDLINGTIGSPQDGAEGDMFYWTDGIDFDGVRGNVNAFSPYGVLSYARIPHLSVHDWRVPVITYPSSNNTGQYIVSWTEIGTASYQLERSDDGGTNWSEVYSDSETSYSENVDNGSYKYRMRAINNQGSSEWLTGEEDCIVNIAPTSITYPASSSSGEYIVSWASTTGALSYQLERSDDEGISWIEIYSDIEPSYLENISNGTYRYRVRATTNYGTTDWQSGIEDCVVNIIIEWIDYPAESSNGQYMVSWPLAIGATSYQLQRSYDGGNNWFQVCSETDAYYNEITGNGNYRYRVAALINSELTEWCTGTKDCAVNIENPYGGGNGTIQEPYLLYTAEDVNFIGISPGDWDKDFKLMADVNMLGKSPTPIGNSIVEYTGTFDGYNHKIRNVLINRPDANYIGFFGFIDGINGQQVMNLGLEDVNITGNSGVGGLAGKSWGYIANCYSTGKVSGNGSIGGLVGYNSSYYPPFNLEMPQALYWENTGTIVNCYSSASVIGGENSSAGGLVGDISSHYAIAKCHSTGQVVGRRAGGLVGAQQIGGKITDSYATGDVESNVLAGGLVGYCEVSSHSSIPGYVFISNCHSSGNVTGATAGGLIGDFTDNRHLQIPSNNSIINCHAEGNVNGYSAGGLIGGCGTITVDNCYAKGDVSVILDELVKNYSISGLICRENRPPYFNSILTINNSYASGTINANVNDCNVTAGGLLAGCYRAKIKNCLVTCSMNVSGNRNLYVGGLVGYKMDYLWASTSFWDVNSTGITTSAGGEGKTTAELKTLSTYTNAGWDFMDETTNGPNDVWRMCEDGSYPRLSWEYSQCGDYGCPDGTDIYDLKIFSEQWLIEELKYDLYYSDKEEIVNFKDLGIFAYYWNNDKKKLAEFCAEWLKSGTNNIADIAPEVIGDGIVNILDFAIFAEHWLNEK